MMSGNEQLGGMSTIEKTRSILLIDDRPEVAKAIEIIARMNHHDIDFADTPEAAFSRLASKSYDVILLDLNFTPGRSDGVEGLDCLRRIVADDPQAYVLVLTAHGGIRTAVAAMQAGARDFVVKPWKNSELVAKLEQAFESSRVLRKEADSATEVRSTYSGIILGESAAIEAVRELVRLVGPTPASVLISGRSGSGRSVVACAIHRASRFADELPVRIDLRDEHSWERLEPSKGTLILQNADDLDEVTQVRLFERLPTAARLIAIVGRNANLVPKLHSRLATIEIVVPGLNERREDIPLLARHFLRQAAERFDRAVPELTDAARLAIVEAEWRDEVRGLALAMERSVVFAEGGQMDAAALSLPARQVSDTEDMPSASNFNLDRSERTLISAALTEHHHNISHAAKALGLSRAALYRRMERYGL